MTPKEHAEKLVAMCFIMPEDFPQGFPESMMTLKGVDAKAIARVNAKVCCKVALEALDQIIGDRRHMWSTHEAETRQFYEDTLKAIDSL